MALRCTVFGHRWGEAGTERERAEDGDEVVVTVREIRTCDRCGAEEILGESMEVTAIERNDPDPTDAPPEPSAQPPERDDDDEVYDAETDDGVILDDEGDDGGRDDGERSPREWPGRPERDDQPDESGEPTPWPESARPDDEEPPEDRFVAPDERSGDEDAPDDETSSASDRPTGDPSREHDHVVEAGIEESDDQSGDGQSADDQPADDRTGIPRAERDDGGDTVRERDDGAGGRDDGVDAHDDAAPGAPEETTDEPAAMGSDATRHPDDDAEVLEATETNEQSRVTAADPVDPTDHASGGAVEGGSSRDDVSLDPDDSAAEEPASEDVEYHCPECGFVDDSEWPSRRAGDVCPDCRRSYLAEREKQS